MSPRLRRASLVPLAVAALGLLAFAAPASAAVTVSNVTAPSDQSFIHYDGANPSITVVGTSNGTTGDAVDLYCTNGVGTTFTTTLIKAAVPVRRGRLHLLGRPTGTKARACVIRAFPAAATGPARGHEPHDLHRAARVPRGGADLPRQPGALRLLRLQLADPGRDRLRIAGQLRAGRLVRLRPHLAGQEQPALLLQPLPRGPQRLDGRHHALGAPRRRAQRLPALLGALPATPGPRRPPASSR